MRHPPKRTFMGELVLTRELRDRGDALAPADPVPDPGHRALDEKEKTHEATVFHFCLAPRSTFAYPPEPTNIAPDNKSPCSRVPVFQRSSLQGRGSLLDGGVSVSLESSTANIPGSSLYTVFSVFTNAHVMSFKTLNLSAHFPLISGQIKASAQFTFFRSKSETRKQ